jgi:anti-anti-sigma regulatory factor
MPFSISNHQGSRILKLEGAVTIGHAKDLAAMVAAMLGESLDDSASMVVDTEYLEDIDTCMLQVLCSLRKAAPAVSFDSPSDAFIRALDRCGMRHELLGAKESL